MASKSNPSGNNPSLNELRRRNNLFKEYDEANENEEPPVNSQASNKKIFGGKSSKSDNTRLSSLPKTLSENNPEKGKPLPRSHEKNKSSEKIHPLSGSSPRVEYDPVTNYISPRPAFLRYDPNKHKEILSRMKDFEEDSLSDDNLVSSSSISSKIKDEEKQFQDEVENEEEVYGSDYEELEVENEKNWCSKNVWKWLFPFVILLVLNYYLFSISTPLKGKNSSINSFYSSSSCRYKLIAHMGVRDVCFYIGNEMCDLVISDVVNDSDTWMIDENNKELSSLQEDESNKAVNSLQENIVSSCNFYNGRYNLGFHMGVTRICFNAGEALCDLVASDVLTNNDFITLDALEPSVKKSVESMHESTCNDEKLVNGNGNGSTDEFLIHEPSNESEESKKEVNTVHDSDVHDSDEAESDENFDNSYEVSNKFGLMAIHDAVNMKLILFLGCLLLVMLAFWIVLSMYFAKSHKIVKDLNVTPSALMNEQKESFILHRSNSVEVNKSKNVENEGKGLNLFDQSSSSSPKDENLGVYASRTPEVELLCEFSIVDDLKYYGGAKKIKKSQEMENYQVSRPRKSVKTAMNSSPSNGGNANEKQLKKEMKMATPTPVRRSSRLQNRLTPPPDLPNLLIPPNL